MRLLRALMVGAKVHSALPVTAPAPPATTLAGYVPLACPGLASAVPLDKWRAAWQLWRSLDGINAEPRTCGIELKLYCNTCEF